MGPSEIASVGYEVAEANEVVFLMRCGEAIAEEVKGLVSMIPKESRSLE